MLFNTHEFIFGFLPLALIGFFALGTISRSWAFGWLILASVAFYAWWRPLNVLIIAPSILVNFALAQILLRIGDAEERGPMASMVLLLGIAFNIAFLGYFKYVNFASTAINDIFGANLVLTQIILPLGISFITFQKIAFLIDVHAGRVRSIGLRDYCLFVLFFPQLIAGPIVHYREMMPQFHKVDGRFNGEDFAVGLTLFVIGLFKKVCLADNIGPLVGPIHDQAAAGAAVPLLPAWLAAVGFTLQIYFDFSGYSDMALGLARFFGIRLPPNFNSPLRASSIIDFWLRWHMTLTRFLTAYIYNPLSLWLTRRWLARGGSALGGRNTTLASFVYLLAFPTVVTMLISGLWHGAGYLYILWGLVHGLFLAVNHGWRLIAPRLWPDKAAYDRVMTPVGHVLTFVSVAAAMVLFRSPTVDSAANLLLGMAGVNGVAVAGEQAAVGAGLLQLTGWTLLLLLIALACPNSLQVLARYEPAFGVKAPRIDDGAGWRLPQWRPSLAWAAAVSVVAAIGVRYLGGPSEFLYWQF